MNMTDEQILVTADACGMMLFSQGWNRKKFEFCLLAFAKQMAKLERHHEREACARTLESISNAPDMQSYANAIRARGEA